MGKRVDDVMIHKSNAEAPDEPSKLQQYINFPRTC